jgi:hypothetical protein
MMGNKMNFIARIIKAMNGKIINKLYFSPKNWFPEFSSPMV